MTVTDAAGATVTLKDGPARRVVALEWEYAEILTTLGKGDRIVGMSDMNGYNTSVSGAVPLTSKPADVGERLEPSVESIADLHPDVIVASARSIPQSVRGQLAAIAPVLVLDMKGANDPLDGVKQTTATLGKLVGSEDVARDWSAKLDAALASNSTKIQEAGASGKHATFAYVFAKGSTASIRMHVPGSAPNAVIEKLGLKPAWTDSAAKGGLSYLDVEGLTRLPADTWFLYWDEVVNPVEKNLAGNKLWSSLQFVKDSHVAGVAKGVWVYGGPQSLITFSDQVTAALTTAR
ncbi:ABC transporter substrate-binding protein [Tsukamurella tyrosinosolvens]|uniref:ABC transporter substrate-binding protein n=1 Tax=Tsukamurella tyrosinosolvens TaxID=57704 RepID=UPI0036AA24EA